MRFPSIRNFSLSVLRRLRRQGFTPEQIRLAQLDHADLNGADLSDVDLSRAGFFQAELNGALLDRAEMKFATLNLAELNRARLNGAKLDSAELLAAKLNEAELMGARLNDADLGGAELQYARLDGAQLKHADLQAADLTGATLDGANLSGARLKSCDISEARMVGATLPYRVPVIEDLDRQILEQLEGKEHAGKLDMRDWHSCETTHCRAGWAIALAGHAGAMMEDIEGPEVAGALLYAAATGRVPNFYASDDAALEDLRRAANTVVPSTERAKASRPGAVD